MKTSKKLRENPDLLKYSVKMDGSALLIVLSVPEKVSIHVV